VFEVGAGVNIGKFFVANQGGKELSLYRTEGSLKYKVDSTKVLADGSFTFHKEERPLGYYKLSLMNENNIIDVILNPKESEVYLKFTQPFLERGIVVIESQENKASKEYKSKELITKKRRKSIQKQRGQFKSQGNNLKVNELTNSLENLEKDLFTHTEGIIKKNPNTFFAKSKMAGKTTDSTEKETYFDDLDFTNESYIRSEVFNSRFSHYIVKHSGHTEVGYYNAVDVIMNKAKANEKVFEFALYNLLDGFYGSGLEDVATYIMEEYFYGEACGEIEVNDLLKQKAQLIKNLQVGNVPPDFTVQSNFGEQVNLRRTCSNNKYTTVMFWASHCGHCMQELPGFVKIYNQYKPKGFEIIGVALDVNPNKWKKTIQDNNFSWKNVSEFKNYKSPVCKDYKVNKTPTFFVLDNQMKIVYKPKGTKELTAFLRKNL
jgi:thiol-disulfide isomerase/thioredoxin